MIKKITTIYNVKFQAMDSYGTEGGMEEEFYGRVEDSLDKAIHNLEVARLEDSKLEGFVACYVTKVING